MHTSDAFDMHQEGRCTSYASQRCQSLVVVYFTNSSPSFNYISISYISIFSKVLSYDCEWHSKGRRYRYAKHSSKKRIFLWSKRSIVPSGVETLRIIHPTSTLFHWCLVRMPNVHLWQSSISKCHRNSEKYRYFPLQQTSPFEYTWTEAQLNAFIRLLIQEFI